MNQKPENEQLYPIKIVELDFILNENGFESTKLNQNEIEYKKNDIEIKVIYTDFEEGINKESILEILQKADIELNYFEDSIKRMKNDKYLQKENKIRLDKKNQKNKINSYN